MKRILLAIFALATTGLLTACGASDIDNNASENEKNIKELVEDYSTGKIKDESASITSNQLIVAKSDKKKVIYDLPEEEFFVSIAPYVNQTHRCQNHSLTGCQGEMDNEEFEVYIEDSKGNVVVDEKLSSQANGFIDFWLPRDETYFVSIKHSEGQTEGEISTFAGDYTCITTMNLQ